MEEERPKRMALIASQGTLDWAYPPFILASTAVEVEMQVAVFFTFYGLTEKSPQRLPPTPILRCR